MTGIDWPRVGVIHPDIPAEHYHGRGLTKRPALSASIAKLIIARSPLHAWTAHPELNPDYQPEEKDSFDLGSVAHVLLLQGDQFANLVDPVDAPDWRTKIAKEAKDNARAKGLIPILEKDWKRTVEMVQAIRAQLPLIDADPPLFADGKPEQTLIWEEEGGVLCKARIDWLHNDYRAADDLKSLPTKSGTANPHVWTRRTFWAIGCDIEACFHARGIHALTGTWPRFRFVIAECHPPYAISVVDLAPSAWELAQRKVDFALRKWARCLERDEWPGYERQVASVELDSWQEADFLRLTYDEEVAAA